MLVKFVPSNQSFESANKIKLTTLVIIDAIPFFHLFACTMVIRNIRCPQSSFSTTNLFYWLQQLPYSTISSHITRIILYCGGQWVLDAITSSSSFTYLKSNSLLVDLTVPCGFFTNKNDTHIHHYLTTTFSVSQKIVEMELWFMIPLLWRELEHLFSKKIIN